MGIMEEHIRKDIQGFHQASKSTKDEDACKEWVLFETLYKRKFGNCVKLGRTYAKCNSKIVTKMKSSVIIV
jgi:hypothetical protein